MNQKEHQYLSSLINKFKSDTPSIVMRVWFTPVLWVLCALIFLVLIQLYERGHLGIFYVVGFSALAGAGVGIVCMLQVSERYWPFLKNHINQQSVNERIEEINA